MKLLLLESVAGVAGDMFTAAFLDAGLVDEEAVRAVPGLLGLEGVEVVVSQRSVAGMRATHLDVVDGSGASHAADFETIDRLLADSGLDDAAKGFARKVFRLLAEAEAEAHGVEVAKVHFHEVGAVDSVVDVALAGLCVALTAPERLLATPVKLGRGTIRIQHGLYPVPPPASARLSRGFRIADLPAEIGEPDIELSTPTGLAILKALEPSFTDAWPAGVVVAQGMGCGTMDLGSYPNVFRIVLLDVDESRDDSCGDSLPYASDTVVEICCNIDDESPERVAWSAEQLLSMGALDVWTTPLCGKKGRIALCLSALVTAERQAALADWILRHTSTFGIRYRTWNRLKLLRHIEKRDVQGEQVAFKVGRTLDGETIKEKPEFEDLRRVWDKE